MFAKLKQLLGIGPRIDLGEIIAKGAVIIDVRTTGEFMSGHIKGSINVPLNVLPTQIDKLKKDKPIITCCASGMRSGSARIMLMSKGFTEVYNGGSWYNLKQYEK